ncbi:hypothetical protein [Roseibium sediminicola]|uniref:YceI-like domain-containing protein n=1 Tax=Roseibium sediminicola TaxID=2933272 RepID=A0ABT0GV09_9HYPH|nr:hypothetical protein [Roseibium sp. CAU 1639]MCK7613266.1 hypothetical protein [Roseibium sp. CAU 1639]
MATWKPAQREPDALRSCVYDYLRTRSPQVYAEGNTSATHLGRSQETMCTGEPLTIDLTLTPVGIATVNTRSALVFGVAGHAADRKTGYEVDGKIVIDRATLAFLSIEANLTVINRG